MQLNSTALCRNIIRGIGAADLPPLESFPRAHQVTYQYYMAVFAFLREDYAEAERRFRVALEQCHHRMKRNIEYVPRVCFPFVASRLSGRELIGSNARNAPRLILDYLIPLLLLRGVFPSPKLLSRSSRHMTLYRPFIDAIKLGDVPAYERQLELAEKRLMERGTYLVVERAREAAVRGLLKKACVRFRFFFFFLGLLNCGGAFVIRDAGGVRTRERERETRARLTLLARHATLLDRWILESKPARMPIETFRNYYNAAWRVHYRRAHLQGQAPLDPIVEDHFSTTTMGTACIDSEETECLLANMIFKVSTHSHAPGPATATRLTFFLAPLLLAYASLPNRA